MCNGLAADPPWPSGPLEAVAVTDLQPRLFVSGTMTFVLAFCCETLGFKACECVCKPPMCCSLSSDMCNKVGRVWRRSREVSAQPG